MSMKSTDLDGGECWRKWYRTRRANLMKLSGILPKNLCVDQLNLTVCSRYADSLLKKPRIKRYLAKYHGRDLHRLEMLVNEFEEVCEVTSRAGES